MELFVQGKGEQKKSSLAWEDDRINEATKWTMLGQGLL